VRQEVVYRDRYRESWDVYPFNAGYFMCVCVKGVEAEALRLHLLSQYGVGVISIGTENGWVLLGRDTRSSV
jgi:hypothetical protein